MIDFYLLNFATKAGTAQQHMPITVGPYRLTHAVNFLCGRNRAPGENPNFRTALTYVLFSHEDWVQSHCGDALLGINLQPRGEGRVV